MEVRVDRGEVGVRGGPYTVHINITPVDPMTDCEDYLDFKNLREFIEYLVEHGEELLEKMDECDVEIVFGAKEKINGKFPWAVSLWENGAIIRVNMFGVENKQLRECQEKLAKIRELVR